MGRRTTGIRVRKPGRKQVYSHTTTGAYARENETVRDVTTYFCPEQLLLSTSTFLLHGFASASLREPSYSYASWCAPVFTGKPSRTLEVSTGGDKTREDTLPASLTALG